MAFVLLISIQRSNSQVTEASLSILQEKDALELKVAQLQTDYDAYKVEVDQDVKV